MPPETIAWYQIAIAALLTGGAVAYAARRSGWPAGAAAAASVGTVVVIAAWRWLANIWQLNDDFLPLISPGDAACLVAGAIAPTLAALGAGKTAQRRWLPPLVGGLGGFIINVVVL